MTFLEKVEQAGLNREDIIKRDCPSEYGLPEDLDFCHDHDCDECWSREYTEPTAEETSTVEPMRHFDTGAVRDSATGKGRFDLLPFAAIHALARHCERGALHYGERNVDKGIPQHSLIDSALRHLGQYVQGDAEDYHLVAALWNIAWACEQEIKRPEMIDLPERNEHSGKAV